MTRREYRPPAQNEDALSDLAADLYTKLRDLVHSPGDGDTREEAKKICRIILARLN